MLEKQAIRVVQSDQKGFATQVFLVLKKDEGHRLVINLKVLSRFEHFKMEGFHMVKDMAKKGDWSAKIDLKDVYLLVPVHPSHQKFPALVSMAGQSIPVPVCAIWSILCLSHLHKTN